ncbi:ribosomal protein S18-alanine N-acetyltransferase [Ideonella livida]|nr:ribosomal protein S18-alanine N-acetyltransferase [Ideonella livida]
MTLADLPAVLALEARAHAWPWRPGHFSDSLAAGHEAWVMEEAAGLLGYYVAMSGVDEAHLLNITVDPARQRQGWGRRLLAHLADRCRALRAACLWLEVREGNRPARALYEAWGFESVGVRRHYYPAASGPREHACVMRWPLPAGEVGA